MGQFHSIRPTQENYSAQPNSISCPSFFRWQVDPADQLLRARWMNLW
jgi:hypothetical protein